jgi:hypothetical protein
VTVELLSNTTNELLPSTTDEIPVETTSDVLPSISNEENLIPMSPMLYATDSPELPQLDDDPVLFSIESPDVPITDISNTEPQDCIIIVPCSDDEDYEDEEAFIMNKYKIDEKKVEPLPSCFV